MFTLSVNDDIQLALVQPSFAAQYYSLVSTQKSDLGEWLSWPLHAHSEKFFADFILHALHDYADGKSMTCAIIYRGEIVGNVSFNTINVSLKKVQIGYWLAVNYRGKGIMSTVVGKMMEFAFNQLAMQKVEIFAATENIPSRAVCERLNMHLEGVITQAENLNGRIVDHAMYGLSKEKWLANQGLGDQVIR